MADLLIHLRLHFQLLLAPIFLWGFFLADGRVGGRALAAFALVHVCLYGGATAFNSAFDRDEGPVGGLERPPPVRPALLPFSLAVLGLGWLLSAPLGWALFGLYGAILLLALAYSHPLTRWKAAPGPSLATIFVGQGLLGFLCGWAAAGAPLRAALGPTGLLGALSAALIVLGFYPLTQLFQIEEDAARGDRTLAVAWGPARCFRVAEAAFALGGLGVLGLVWPRYGWAEAGLALAFFLALLAAVEAWRRRFDPAAVLANFRRVSRLNAAAALGLAAYIGWHLLRGD